MKKSVLGFFAALVGLSTSVFAGADQVSESKPLLIDQAPDELKEVIPRLWAVTFSPDGKLLAVAGGWDNPREPGELVLWDVAVRQTKLIWRQASPIRTTAFSPDGKSLAIGDFAGATRLLEPGTGKVIRTFPKHFKVVNSVAFTPDNKNLVTASLDGTIKLWDITTGEERPEFPLPGEGIVKVAISNDGLKLAAVTWLGKGHIWDVTRREELQILEASKGEAGRTQIAEAVAFAPDGKSLVTGSWDTTLRIWDTADGKLLRDLVGQDAPVQSAAISPDGKTLASGDAQGKVTLFNYATGERLATLKAHADRCFGLAFSPNGRLLATAGWDRLVKVWDLEKREPIATLERKKR